MWSRFRLLAVCALAELASGNAAADSMAVPTVELREEVAGRYVLEAQMAVELAPFARRPEPPARCFSEDPRRADEGGTIRLTVAIDCGDEPLGPRDVLVLPWAVDGIQLTATWADGSTRRALFGREPAGVVVRLHLILEREESFLDLARRYGIAGFEHALRGWNHLLLVVGFALALSGSVRSAGAGVVGFASGHAVSLVLAELGFSWLPLLPAEAFLSGVVVLLAAGSIQDGATRHLGAVALVAGTLHGLGMAAELLRSGIPASKLVAALFLTNTGVDAGHVLTAVATVAVWRVRKPALERWRSTVGAVVGLAASVLFFAILQRDWATATTRADGSGFLEVEASTRVPLSAPTIATTATAPPQTDAAGRLASSFMSYLVIEPYQVRHEVLVDVSATREWLDVTTDPSGAIPVEAQDALLEAMTGLIADRVPIAIDGAPAPLAEGRAEFVSIGPTGALTRESPIAESLATAIVGVTLVYETETIATSVELDWGLFSDDVPAVPLTLTDPLAVAETELSAESPPYEWRHTLEGFELPTIEAISVTKPRVPLVSLALAILALAVFFLAGRTRAAAICLVTAYLLYPFARVEAAIPIVGEARIDPEEAARVTEQLLTNVYRSLDIRNEDAIYDRLALSVTGDQLLDVYLESRRALELENRGGARVRIDEVVVREVREVRETEDGGYELDAVWTVGGSVNHFGHVHFRQNRYDATITVVPVEDAWKIRSVELVEEERVL
jgi:hypothetical protein